MASPDPNQNPLAVQSAWDAGIERVRDAARKRRAEFEPQVRDLDPVERLLSIDAAARIRNPFDGRTIFGRTWKAAFLELPAPACENPQCGRTCPDHSFRFCSDECAAVVLGPLAPCHEEDNEVREDPSNG